MFTLEKPTFMHESWAFYLHLVGKHTTCIAACKPCFMVFFYLITSRGADNIQPITTDSSQQSEQSLEGCAFSCIVNLKIFPVILQLDKKVSNRVKCPELGYYFNLT